MTREGAPENNAYARIIKYDGNQKEPRWMDVEPGIRDSAWSPDPALNNSKDRFKELCRITADISAAPSTRVPGSSGKMCYYREFDVVLLTGLTEMKAQIRWTDSVTVRTNE